MKDMKAFADSKVVRCIWVLCNTEDAQNQDVRARLVECEVTYSMKEDSFYAATPALPAKNIIHAKCAQEHINNAAEQRISFVDTEGVLQGYPEAPHVHGYPT